jgi:hypothetical protein
MKQSVIVTAALCAALLWVGHAYGQSVNERACEPGFPGGELARMHSYGRGPGFEPEPGPGNPAGRMRPFGDKERMRAWIKLKKLLLEEQVDLNAVHDYLKKIGDLQVEVRMLRIRQWLDIEKVLTPEQRLRVKSERSFM